MTDAAPNDGADPRNDEVKTPRTAGERLAAAREAQGLSLDDIALRTRVPIRHLVAIESGDYSEMPTPTYAIGFAKAYARAVGEDEVTIARDVRGHTASISAARQNYQPYELDDPTRVPPRGVAMIAGIIAVIVLIGAAISVGSGWFGGSSSTTESVVQTPPPPSQPRPTPPVPAINNSGQVTLTALQRVWVRVHDGSGKTLFEATMNPGDHYEVPANTSQPQLTVGRPDALQITVDGKTLPPLGSGARPMKDVPIDAAALAVRANAAAASAGAAATAPATGANNQSTAAPTTTVAPSPAPTPTSTPSPAATHRAEAAPAKPKPAPSKKLDLDLSPAPPPLPTTNGIY